MSRLTGWFRSSGKTADDASDISDMSQDKVAKEMEDIDDAMQAAALIMNDDIEGAGERLKLGDSSFHQLGLAVTIFMRSVLGFEKDVMNETTTRLDECEAKAWTDGKKAQKHGKARAGSKLYLPGTEYDLVRAETQLMGAVVGVLHESLIEAMKSFYKLRKAFLTLDAIIQQEEKIIGGVATGDISRVATPKPPGDELAEKTDGLAVNDDADSSKPDSVNDKDSSTGTETPADLTTDTTSEDFDELKLAGAKSRPTDAEPALLDNPLDVFVHSGANMCFGILLLILSLVPPAFSRILSVVGFHGDRDRGVKMLWRSTPYDNVNGAISGMCLLAYYNGLLGAVDILPDEKDFDETAQMVGPPKEKCDKLLATMRARYPDSRLWRVEEARQHANEHNLSKAIEVLTTGTESKMKQVTALNNFELSINSMFVQDWNLMRDSFVRCVEVNDWSPALYFYLAGSASLELYRDAVQNGDEDEARRQKTKTEEFFRKAPTLAGKKRFMARQLPFEVFLLRKMQKWEDRAKASGVDLADAIGTSPAIEMCYMWNGPKRMGPAELERAMGNLKWERCTAKSEVVDGMKEEVDEMGLWALVEATLLKRLGKFDEARALLQEHVLKHDRAAFKGPTKDDYILAAATYEMGSIAWAECCAPPAGTEEEVREYRHKKLDECQKYLDITKVWEAFVLDARIGMRVQSGLETLKWFRTKMAFT
ncbi:Fc.00g009900.m01.CDS01 [Cosmosporella sp. VM-42]